MCQSTELTQMKSQNNKNKMKIRRNKRDRISIILHGKNDITTNHPKFKFIPNENDSDAMSALMGISGLGVLIMVYLAAFHGWRGRVNVVGIDLGTTNSVVCVQALSHSV